MAAQIKGFPELIKHAKKHSDSMYTMDFNALLYRKTKTGNILLPIPTEFRKQLISTFHHSIGSLHQGINRTYELFRLRFYWPKMFYDISDVISRCIPCALKKPDYQNRVVPFGQRMANKFPFQHLFIDVTGPLHSPITPYKYILTVVCGYSRFCFAYPLIETSAETILAFIWSRTTFNALMSVFLYLLPT